jgi:glutathione S-transferase
VRLSDALIMMTTVLRFHSDTSKPDPRLVAYLDRCTARPAFRRALDAQLADFRSAAA